MLSPRRLLMFFSPSFQPIPIWFSKNEQHFTISAPKQKRLNPTKKRPMMIVETREKSANRMLRKNTKAKMATALMKKLLL
jgi:hypothetical protein